jgi:hypothetical protein
VKPYTVRLLPVRVGSSERSVLVAAFPLEGGGAACIQLRDHDELRRGGVYLTRPAQADLPALAPRFDELFADAAVKLRARDGLRAPLLDLLRRARDVARRSRPRLEPPVLEAIAAIAREAVKLERACQEAGPLPGAFSLEALVVCLLLIFVSEEERYPRPRFRGGDVALERLLEALPLPPPRPRRNGDGAG